MGEVNCTALRVARERVRAVSALLSVTGEVSACRRGVDERDAIELGRAPDVFAEAVDSVGAASALVVACFVTATL